MEPVVTPTTRKFRYSLNLGWFFADQPLSKRVDLAARAGFTAVELFWPGEDLPSLSKKIKDTCMDVAMINLYEGNYSRGDRGFLCDQNRVGLWQTKFLEAIEACTLLHCRRLNILTGDIPEEMPRAVALAQAVRTLSWATPYASERNIKLVIEPLNHLTHPHYLCQRTIDVLELISYLDTNTVGIEYDLYHAQISEGNLLQTIESNISSIYHIQLADCPTRESPGTGEINFNNIIAKLVDLQYSNFVGLEYSPREQLPNFEWLPRTERGR